MKFLFTIIGLSSIFFTFGQGEANIWYFGGHAGLDFSSGSPVVLTDGALNTIEGCATISDANGQLLFYTDGVTVYNKLHQVMPNGQGLFGDTSTTQSAIAIPKPGSTTGYYIFTCAVYAGPDGFRYSEVDMNLDGGLGDVISKNTLLKTPVCEKMTAIKKASNDGYYIVVHGWGSNDFLTYDVSASGVNAVPIISNVGPVVFGNELVMTVGYLKFSPDGTKLLSANPLIGLDLYDFNISTGTVSNPVRINSNYLNYGLEFSPNSEIAYVTTSGADNFDTSHQLVQYDLTAADIGDSEILLYSASVVGFGKIGALQLAPDMKIYAALYDDNFIGCIKNPNILGTGCDFEFHSVNLSPNISNIGLPQFIQSYFNPVFTVQNLCLGSVTSFQLSNGTDPSVSILWDFGDGQTSTATNPTHQYNLAGIYTVTVSATTSSGTVIKSKNIRISSVPIASVAISDQYVCGNSGMIYNLSQFNSQILNNQSSTVFGVSYFATGLDAQNHDNELSQNYILPIGVTDFFVKVYDFENVSCNFITSFKVTLYQSPIAYQPSNYVICESLPYDNKEIFNLIDKNGAILNGQNSTDFDISYHSSQLLAESGGLSLPHQYPNINPIETIFARIQNKIYPGCYSITSFTIQVVREPNLIIVPDFEVCDDSTNDGIGLFDLKDMTLPILNGDVNSPFVVKYYFDMQNASDDQNEIISPINNSSPNQIIYYAIGLPGINSCKVIGFFRLKVVVTPFAKDPGSYYLCDDITNDGSGIFDLNGKSQKIIDTQNSGLVSVTYHSSQADANLNNAPLNLNYENTSNPQTIFARVENVQNKDCFSTVSFEIGLYKMPKANTIADLFTCDDDLTNGTIHNLELKNPDILQLQSENDFRVLYYLSETDAVNSINQLSYQFDATANSQKIIARVENRFSKECFAMTSFNVVSKQAPVIDFEDLFPICDGTPLLLKAPSGFDSYLWSNGSTNPTTTINDKGNYFLRVTKNHGDITCSSTKNFEVVNSNKAIIIEIITSDWTDDINSLEIVVQGDGKYKYSIDGENYQDSPFFYNLRNEIYTIYVKDSNGCGIADRQVALLMYPKFFTPNDDGYNDYWRIKFSSFETFLDVYIYDRYGKLLHISDKNSKGWDGTHNGKIMPSDDYWFVAKRDNGREYKGHFSLKR